MLCISVYAVYLKLCCVSQFMLCISSYAVYLNLCCVSQVMLCISVYAVYLKLCCVSQFMLCISSLKQTNTRYIQYAYDPVWLNSLALAARQQTT